MLKDCKVTVSYHQPLDSSRNMNSVCVHIASGVKERERRGTREREGEKDAALDIPRVILESCYLHPGQTEFSPA